MSTELGTPGFIGYSVEHEEEVCGSGLWPEGWTQHPRASVIPYGLFIVLKRKEDRDESHGPGRLAMLFMAGMVTSRTTRSTARMTGRPPPFLVVVQDHGFGGNYSSFGKGGRLERIARRRNVFPKWLLVGARSRQERFEPWSGYGDAGTDSEPRRRAWRSPPALSSRGTVAWAESGRPSRECLP